MLWFKSVVSVQWAVGMRKLLLSCFISIFITSCGFSPIYSQEGDNADIASKLLSVEVKPINTLIGQQYVKALEDVLDPSHIGATKNYIIEVNLNKSVLPLAIEQDRTITRYKVVVTADYSIKEISGGKILSRGILKNEADYDKVDSDYATHVSENDTASRTIRELAKDTKVKIISALLK
jgi:LPS-assembly lipoprotein